MLNLFGIMFIVEVTIIGIAMMVHRMSTVNKLRIIKYGAIFISSAVILAAKCGVRSAKAFELPLTWLRHYIVGNGSAMRVPDKVVADAKSAIRRAILDSDEEEPFGRYHCLHHSTLYEGRGFYNRPTLFYLVGGFTFLLRRDGLISGKDRYDWHETLNGEYFTSPLGEGSLAVIIMTVLDKVFGNEWFVANGFPSGEAGISNKLWADLKLVGARDFNSWFDQVEVFSEPEKWAIAIENGIGWPVEQIPGDYARGLCDCGIGRYYFDSTFKVAVVDARCSNFSVYRKKH